MTTLKDAQVVVGSEAPLAVEEKGTMVHANSYNQQDDIHGVEPSSDFEEGKPTDEELTTLRRVPGHIPMAAYLLCIVEFAERGSFYGVKQVFSNFVNRPLPAGGNGWGAPPKGTQQTAGALGKGTVVAAAVVNSFGFLVYGLPMLGGWLADAKWGRFMTIAVGIAICGIAHVIMVIAAIPSVLQKDQAYGPFMLSVYVLAIGSALFKPNITVMLLDQNPHNKAVTKILDTGEKVIIDPEVTTERMMLWFYLLINIGGFMGVATSYLAKLVGFWPAYLLPGIIYFILPPLLWYLHPRLVLHKPGGSDLGNVFTILGYAFRGAGFGGFGRTGFFEHAKPSVIASTGVAATVPYSDMFVDDVKKAFQACSIFLFLPIFFINDGGLGGAADALSVMLTTNGVPNDVITNFNPLVIIFGVPVFTYGIWPLFRKFRIRVGPITRIFSGLMFCSIASVGWPIITNYAYTTGPCGNHASSLSCVDANGVSLVSPISIWWTVIPVSLTALCEIVVNVTCYGIAYSRAPPNMRGIVSAVNCFMSAIQYAINLATSYAIQDPYITWAFAGPTIVGFFSAIAFWFTFKHLDKEEYVLNDDAYSNSSASVSVRGNDNGNADEEKRAYS